MKTVIIVEQSVLVQLGHSLPGPPFSSASLAIIAPTALSITNSEAWVGVTVEEWISLTREWLVFLCMLVTPPDTTRSLLYFLFQCECNVLKRIIILHTCVLYIGDTTLIKSLWYKLISNQMCLGNKSFCIVYKTQLYITGISAFWTQIKKMSQNKEYSTFSSKHGGMIITDNGMNDWLNGIWEQKHLKIKYGRLSKYIIYGYTKNL